MTRLPIRLRSALLVGLFLAGSLGLPVADAATFHLAGHDPCAGLTHLEPQGSSHHADRCTLAQPAAAQHEDLGSARTADIALPPATRIMAPSSARPRSAAPLTLQHSRAPPA
ncbi:MAG TPA: hypothetical protein PKA66_01700 [Gemmatimonadales bacterium]|nr:hypothetical protein [Gemmatimonadales bacterium]